MYRSFKILKLTVILASVLLASVSCRSNEDGALSDGDLELLFDAAVYSPFSTKAASEKLPIGTVVRVSIFEAGTYGQANEQLLGNALYSVTDNQGALYPKTPSDRLMVNEGNYDIRLYTPSYVIKNGNTVEIANGDSFMNSVVTNQSITKTSRTIAVTFKRFCARIDLVIKPKSTSILSAMSVSAPVVIDGMPKSGSVVGTNEYAQAADDRTGKSTMAIAGFTTTGTGANTVISSVDNVDGGTVIPVTNFPGSALESIKPVINIPITIDGTNYNAKLDMSTAGINPKPGYRYTIEVVINKGAEPEYTINAEPWVEGDNQSADLTQKPTLGEYFKRGGIVFWVNPDNVDNYKVMYIYQPTVKLLYNDAALFAAEIGGSWRLPLTAELLEAANLKSTIDASLYVVGGSAIAAANYMTSEQDGTNVQVINMVTKAKSAVALKTTLNCIAVKEFGSKLALSTCSPNELVPNAGKSYKTTVSSQVEWVAKDMKLVAVSPSSGGIGDTEVTITVKPNVSTDALYPSVTFADKASPATTGDVKWIAKQYQDIVVYKAANCYVSVKGATVTFDATKKPRSISGAIGHPGFNQGTATEYTDGIYSGLTGNAAALNGKQLTQDLAPSHIGSIQVVWQSLNDNGAEMLIMGSEGENYQRYDFTSASAYSKPFIKAISYNGATGMCNVQVNGTGNALIAAYDGAAGSGKILWSWHIWGTETEPQASVSPSGEPSTNPNGTGKLFMDRNLGALAAGTTAPTVETAYKYFGLLWQWGAKEPYSCQGPTYSTSRPDLTSNYPIALLSSVSKWIQTTTPDETSNSVPSANTLGGYNFSSAVASNTFDVINNPMIYTSNGGQYVNASPTTWTEPQSARKSLYDPCPFGYRVAHIDSWSTMATTGWTNNHINGGVVWNGSWWPAEGNRTAAKGQLYYVGSKANYLSASPNTTPASGPYSMEFNYDGSKMLKQPLDRSAAASVRCVEE